MRDEARYFDVFVRACAVVSIATPQFSGGALPRDARRVCIMK
jgi:hypothetical protein